ncbi:MAG TPA: hypothetical protein VK819_16120 [Acidobacteriaceae bacterium]|jgi:hypothetical protein|nr:hypothetical protein [Acidobacteriaceae bacterium]
MTPSIAIVHVHNPHWRGIRLWIPLFLLWIPALLLAPLILLAVVVACLVGRVNPWTAISSFWGLLCALPGTHVHVNSPENQVLVRIL